MIRLAAVQTLDWVPLQQRYGLLQRLMADPSKAVRMSVARQLAGVPPDALAPAESTALQKLNREYLLSLRHNADMPEEQMNLGLYHQAQGDAGSAERAYRAALKLSPNYIPALLNLADLYRASEMDDQATPLLQQAIRLAPQNPAPQHAMGLLMVRQGELQQALPYLKAANDLQPQNLRYSYVHAIALWEAGQKQDAVSRLEAALANNPGNRQLIEALASYYQQLGERAKLEALLPQQ